MTSAVSAELDRAEAHFEAIAAGLDPHDPVGAAGRSTRARSGASSTSSGSPRPRGSSGRPARSRRVHRRAHAVSLLFHAQQVKLAENQSYDGVEVYRIRGGNDQLPKALAESLPAVIRSEPVTSVVQIDNSVQVVSDGVRISADYCVLAAPFPALRRIRFTPALPPGLAAAVAGLTYGTGTQTFLSIDRAPGATTG